MEKQLKSVFGAACSVKRFDDDDDDDDRDETGNPYRLDSDETGGIKKKMHLMQKISCKWILDVLYSFLSGGNHSIVLLHRVHTKHAIV